MEVDGLDSTYLNVSHDSRKQKRAISQTDLIYNGDTRAVERVGAAGLLAMML